MLMMAPLIQLNISFASNKKYRKSTISLFLIKQEEKETLMDYVQRFNIAIFEVSAARKKVLVSAFTQGICRRPLFESLAKKPATNFLDVLARAKIYMNLEDAWLVKKNGHDKRKENESPSTRRPRESREDVSTPLIPKLIITHLS
ncbi:UNVERIFIED_CONTAM: hypothetical protein Sradi_0697900 [Sesamum radiatum]|uniref:Retrotransposon gag domain-containing protein n=1 Tax=Sesamum radiatum TaxID=300843 RepID=A0AAW2VLT2_SESRA